MGKKMKRTKTTAAELPEEVLHREILTRLPIKSVVRFKSVSKSWLSLFSNPQFVKHHHTHNATQNPNDYDCLIADKATKIVILSRYKETKLLPTDPTFFLIGSINGLVCLRRDNKLSLWNPAIHQSKEFTFPPHADATEFNIGLGFDFGNDDLKVVVLSSDLRSATVYCSGLDSWSDVGIPENVIPKDDFEKGTPSFIVKGCPYWTCSRYRYVTESYGHRESSYLMEAFLSVVKFNAETNEFDLSPEYHFDRDDYGGLDGGGGYQFCHKFVDMKDCLTLIVHDRNNANCVVEIFRLVGEEGCCVWSKIYTLGPLDFYTRGWYVTLSQGFKYDGEILFEDHGMFSCIAHETEEIKRLRGTTSTDYVISCFRYEPTLFYIQGMKSVHLTTQTRRRGCYRTPRRLMSSLRD